MTTRSGLSNNDTAGWAEMLTSWRYRWVPTKLVGEVLTTKWVDNLIPMTGFIIVVSIFGSLIPEFFSNSYMTSSTRQLGEFALVATAMLIVVLAGGIDLSVGSNFALANISALALFNWFGWPIWSVFASVMLISASVGLINGVLVGYLGLRAFITTLVTMILVRAIVEKITLTFGVDISSAYVDSETWDFIADGDILGIPFSFVVFVCVGIFVHIFLTRTGLGWRVTAVGGSRRAAYNAGIPVRRLVTFTYVCSGALVGLAGTLYAARLGNGGNNVGLGYETLVLTAVLLGGVSLGGGRGSVAKALVGSMIVLIVSNSLVRLGAPPGLPGIILGCMLLTAVAIDIKFLKNRYKILADVYVSPGYNRLLPLVSCAEDAGTPYALNNRLKDVEIIGLGAIEAPEDVILDRHDNLYCGTRHGDIVRFSGPDHTTHEVFAHIGGQPLGLAFDKNDNLLVCVGGMGLYMVTPDRVVKAVTDETNRSRFSITDDARLRLADDLDIAPDGRVFFSEATTRYEMHEWPVEGHESRPNGRIICYDPKTSVTRTILPKLMFPNGICMAHDAESFLFAETYACRISRYWYAGAKAGQVERIIDNLPGFPDNINRASDGNFWLALVGMRTPAHDLGLRMPGFRKRMSREIAGDEWIAPNINTGCVLKLDLQGDIIEALWDRDGINHPMVTSMRDTKAICIWAVFRTTYRQVQNPGCGPGLDRGRQLLGKQNMKGILNILPLFRDTGSAGVTVPPMDGALKPNTALQDANLVCTATRPDNLVFDGEDIFFSSGRALMRLGGTRAAKPSQMDAFSSEISALASDGKGLIAVAFDSGELGFTGNPKAGEIPTPTRGCLSRP